MTAMSAASTSLLAHGLHYGLVLSGLIGLVVLLAPPLMTRAGLVDAAPLDAHEARVEALRRQLAVGGSGVPATGLLLLPAPAVAAGSRTALPLAIVASAAAAGVHAAVVPTHLAGAASTAAFLGACAVAQLAWSALVLRRPTRGLLLAGLVGNLAVLTVWLLSRTTGVPGLDHPVEPFGPWDVTCAAWELLVVVVCAARLVTPHEPVAPWWAWTPAVRGLLAGSVLVLGLLSLSGASS